MEAIVERLRELERSHHLQTPPMATAEDKHRQGLYGLREEGIIESLIDAEFGRHKIYLHPFSNREETPTEREQRMILYDMITTSLVHFKIMFSGEAIGDTYAIMRNVMRYGAPNATKMKIDLTRMLGNYVKRPEQGYQEYELGLRDLISKLAAVKCPVPEDDIVMRLIAGMISDERYEKETKEVSDYLEPYSVCHDLFLRRAQALNNMTSNVKQKTEKTNTAYDSEDSQEEAGSQ